METFRNIVLTDSHIIKPFDCGTDDLNDFLFSDAKNNSRYLHYVTYIIETESQTVAYYSLANDSLNLSANFGMLEEISEIVDPCCFDIISSCKSLPAVKLGRLAVDRKYQSSGIGENILQSLFYSFTHGNKTGCQFMLVDAINVPRVISFYERNGFELISARDIGNSSRMMYRCLINI